MPFRELKTFGDFDRGVLEPDWLQGSSKLSGVAQQPSSPALPRDFETLEALLKEAEPLIMVDSDAATALLLRALPLARLHQDATRTALALVLLGGVHFYRSRYAEAERVTHEALELARTHREPRLEVRARSGLGILARVQGDYGRAMEHHLEGLRLAQAHGDAHNELRLEINIGVLRMQLGEHDLALETQKRAANLARRLHDETAHSIATVNIVVSLYHLGQHAEVVRLAEQHLPDVRALRLRQNEAVLHAHLAHALVELGLSDRAAQVAQLALPMLEALGNQEHLANLRAAYGRALQRLGDLDGAQVQLQCALEGALKYDVKAQQRLVSGYLAEVSAARGDWAEAYAHARSQQAMERAQAALDSERRAMVLGATMQLELHKREAEAERQRNLELARVNASLRDAQVRLAHRATHDPLTGLANRTHFHATLEARLQSLERSVDPRPVGILFIDIDGFKKINDTFGHDIGDQLLLQVARCLRRTLRGEGLIARLGGDEFIVLLSALRRSSDGERIAHRILVALARTATIKGHAMSVTASIGVAVAPEDGLEATTVQRHADVAMYRAKRQGGNAAHRYAAE